MRIFPPLWVLNYMFPYVLETLSRKIDIQNRINKANNKKRIERKNNKQKEAVESSLFRLSTDTYHLKYTLIREVP